MKAFQLTKWAGVVLVVAFIAACGEEGSANSLNGSAGASPSAEFSGRCDYPTLHPTYLPWQPSGEIPEPRRSYDEEIDRAQLSWTNPNNPQDGVGLTVYPVDNVGAPEEPLGVSIDGNEGYLHMGSIGEHSAWWNLSGEHCNFLELSVSLEGVGPDTQDEEVVKVARSLQE
jgi:hypothetical protein